MMIGPLATQTSFIHLNRVLPSINGNYHHRSIVLVPPLRGGLSTGKLRRERRLSCELALKPDSATVNFSASSSLSSSSSSSLSSVSSMALSATIGEDDEEWNRARIGARVRVKAPLKVYHVPKVPEFDLTGMEGELKQYVSIWKEKRISANLPCKVEFVTEIEGRGTVKFCAHLKEDEFEYVDDNRD